MVTPWTAAFHISGSSVSFPGIQPQPPVGQQWPWNLVSSTTCRTQARAKPGSAHQWVSTSPGTPTQSSTAGHIGIWLHPTADQLVLAALYSQSQALVIWPYPPPGHPRLCNQSQDAPTPPNGRSTSALANLGFKPATTQPPSAVRQHQDKDSPGHAASSSEISSTSSQ